MVRRLLMKSALVMLGRFTVVAGSMCVMFRCLLVVLCSFRRHGVSLILLFAALGQVSKPIVRRTLCKIDHITSVWFHGCVSVLFDYLLRKREQPATSIGGQLLRRLLSIRADDAATCA
jgi:hypothetical protein